MSTCTHETMTNHHASGILGQIAETLHVWPERQHQRTVLIDRHGALRAEGIGHVHHRLARASSASTRLGLQLDAQPARPDQQSSLVSG